VTPEKTNREQRPKERTERPGRRPDELGSLDVCQEVRLLAAVTKSLYS
jgi:hypothetical protein